MDIITFLLGNSVSITLLVIAFFTLALLWAVLNGMPEHSPGPPTPEGCGMIGAAVLVVVLLILFIFFV